MHVTSARLRLKRDGTRWRKGGEVKGKLANVVGSQYPSHCLGTWCIQRYYRWCAHLGWTDAPADLNGLVRFAKRRNPVSARAPSHFKRNLQLFTIHILINEWKMWDTTCEDATPCKIHILMVKTHTHTFFGPILKNKVAKEAERNYYLNIFFDIHGSVHRNSILIRSNKTQQFAGIYLLQNHSTCFGCPSHPSSRVHKTVITTSGTGHSNNRATTFLKRGLWPRWRKLVALLLLWPVPEAVDTVKNCTPDDGCIKHLKHVEWN